MEQIKQFQARLRADLAARDEEVAAFIAELERFMRKAVPKALQGIANGERRGLEAAAAIGSLRRNLDDLGLQDLLDQGTLIHFNELERTLATLGITKKTAASLPDTDLNMVEQLVRFDAEATGQIVEETIGSIKPIIMRSVLANEVPDIQAIADSHGEILARQVKTEIDTALSAFNRTVTVTRASDVGLKLFLYFGPDDNKTREFCQKHVDKIYTAEQLSAMDNGQGLPVLQYCGGYNCRHHLAPLSLEMARGLGYGN